jgi:hypothetical protein
VYLCIGQLVYGCMMDFAVQLYFNSAAVPCFLSEPSLYVAFLSILARASGSPTVLPLWKFAKIFNVLNVRMIYIEYEKRLTFFPLHM